MKLLFLIISLTTLFACSNREERKLPILGERAPEERIENGKTVIDTVYQTIPSFSFVNQDNRIITDRDFDGKIYVADFFFTSCTSICPIMHRNMLKVYEKFKGHKEVSLLSHSIDSKRDISSVLKKYATKLGIMDNQWQFVNGARDSIYTIAEKSYLTSVGEDKNADGGYIHQGWFILVDKEKRLRGAYDGTNDGQVKQLIADMHILLNEYTK
ncbi:MAG TPA: SCO family protein [Sphingobacteriaceae bacterium]|nr:SCO family protein [Sphingobacteriaceae bacterium]